MAENIVRLLLRPSPAARVVVWTGEEHAMKRTPPDWPWQHPCMGAHLGEITGEAPFCVGQDCVDWPELASCPKLLVGEHPWLRERGLDATVLHHRGTTPLRPPWLDDGSVDLALPATDTALVQALPAAEGRRAVPAAQWLMHELERLVRLAPGRYLLRGRAGDDRVLWQRPPVVGPP